MLCPLIVAALLTQAPAEPTPYPPAPDPAEATPYPAKKAEPAKEEPPKEEGVTLAAFIPDEGFRLRDESGDYVLRVGLQAAYKFEPTWTDGEGQMRSTLAFMRPILRGNLFKPWITFWTSMELAGNPPYLLDAYFDVVPWTAFGLRAGQQYSPWSRQEQLGPQQLFFPEWAPVADYFWPGRDKGIQFYGLLAEKKFEYYAAIFSGTPLRQLKTIPGNYSLTVRLAVNPLGTTNPNEFPFTPEGDPLPFRVSVGVQGNNGKIETAEENLNTNNGQLKTVPTGDTTRRWAGGLDVWVQGGPVIFSAEAYLREINPLDDSPKYLQHGGFAQLLVDVWAQRIGLGVQFDWLDPNTSVDSDSAFLGEAMVAWFIHNPDLVLKLRYAHVSQQTPADPDATTPYTPGQTNLFTLQMNLSF